MPARMQSPYRKLSRIEGLDKTYDRFQKLISQLEIHGEVISQEDANLKLLISLPSAWNNIALIMRNKSDLDTLSMVIYYSSSTNEIVNTAHSVSTASSKDQASTASYADDVMFSFFANQSNALQLDYEDLEQIDADDLEEMDLKWLNATTAIGEVILLENAGHQGIRGIEIGGSKKECTSGYIYYKCLGCSRWDRPKTVRPSAPIIEEWDTDSDNDSVFRPKSDQTKPKFTKINFVKSGENVNSVNKENTHRQAEYPRKSQSPRSNRRNWNGMMTQKLGNGFEFIKKACFVCGSFNHLIKDCNFLDYKMVEKLVLNNKGRVTGQREIRPVWNNAQRVNHQNKLTHPHPKRNFVPTAVATKSEQVPVNAAKQSSPRASSLISTAKPVNTAAPKPKVNDALPITYSYFKAHSPVRRAFNQKSAVKTNNFNEKVNTARVNNVTTAGPKAVVSAAEGNRENAGNPQYTLQDQGIFDSGCSRHMTGNKSFLTDYQEIDGGFVALFSWVFFLATKDETSGILKTFITGIENQINHKVKIIRCDNGTEFKNNDMNQFCGMKGIKRISLCCQNSTTKMEFANRVLVTKPHNKTPYELLHGKPPSISFMRPFGCPVTILNTLDPLGKFDGKVDEGFLVGYSINSQAFRVFNTRTRKVEENLHITFLENKPNVVGSGPDWLFDINLLTNSMNYEPVTAGNQTNTNAEDAVVDDAGKKTNENPANEGERNGQEKERRNFNTREDTADLNTVRNKARLVAQGYTQEEGIDYDKVFAPVARIEAIRLFLAYASFMGFIVYQMDVKSAFLYGTIEEEVYVCQPPGFEDPQFPDKVYKVEKALYGLHQAPRAWYETLSTYLLENGFRRGTIDKTLFIKKDKGDILLVQVYVDDIIFGSTKKSLCVEFEQMMHKRFQMSSMGELTFFLGLQVKQKDDGIFISQDNTPIETNKALLKDEEAEDVDVHLYRSMIGSLMYLTASRPDIMFVVCACARFQVTPKVSHLHAVKRIFRYLKASLDKKSTIGGCQFLGKRFISWQCKKQTIVANSTTEQIHIDNESTICIVKNPVFHAKPSTLKCKATTFSSVSYEGSAHLREDDRVVRAATTATSLEGTGLGSGTRCQDTTLGDVDAHTRVLVLETSKTAQDLVIKKLKKKVKRLEKKQRARTPGMKLFKIGTSRRKSLDKENVSKQGRNLKTRSMFEEGDFDDDFDDIDDMVNEEMENVEGDTVNAGGAVNTATTGVSAASASVTTAGVSISTAEPRTPPTTTTTAFEDEDLTIAQTLVKMRSEKAKEKGVAFRDVEESARSTKILPTIDPKDKGKGIMQELEKPPKNPRKAQIQRDAEINYTYQFSY
ncbi:retrovirus-related pol polyprotein from transposon TNT 1-94 [Tanacetum coccineum]